MARIAGACLLCDAPAGAVANLCPACRRPLERLAAGAPSRLVAYAYAPPVSTLVHWMKFEGSLPAARTLGALLTDAVLEARMPRPDAIVPVPLHAGRLRARGFNQALELARPLARRLGCPLLPRVCRRVRATHAQSRLAGLAERRRNVADAFRVERPLAHLPRVAVVDDVLTTGATVDAVARALRGAGVARVMIWVCAGRSPGRRETRA